MNKLELKLVKSYFKDVYKGIDFFQESDLVQINSNRKLSEYYKIDYVTFILYMMAADGELNIDEIKVYQYFTGFDGDDLDTIKESIETSGVMSPDFQASIPPSLQYLVQCFNACPSFFEVNETPFLVNQYLMSFALTGRQIAKADNYVPYTEKQHYDLYINNLISYIKNNALFSIESSFEELLAVISESL